MLTKPTDFIASLAKGLRVIEAFSVTQPRLSVAQAAEIAELDRASARRCLLTLHQLGYVDYDGKFFTPTPRILRLGLGTLAALPLAQVVQPWLDQLSETVGQSVSVSILDETDIVYVARAAQRRVMSIGLMPGSRLPAHCTSMGRVLLAALPETKVRAVLAASTLAPRTRFSITDPDELISVIRAVADNGYALLDQEVEIGLRALAVPLVNHRGQTVAALNIGIAAIHERPEMIIDQFLARLLRVQTSLRQNLN